MTLGAALDEAKSVLCAAGVDDYAFDALCLMCEATGLDKAALLASPARELSRTELDRYLGMVARRTSREPLQHILGTAGFMDFFVNVSAAVLIPRPETETLVEVFIEGEPDKAISILDLGTGSGCIAIALKRAGYKKVTATDISEDALKVARGNAAALGVDICFREADLFDGITERFDAVISNPPYIPSGDIKNLMPEVRAFDPLSALDGGEDGLDFYRRIARECGDRLVPGGRLYLELGTGESDAVGKILTEAGFSGADIDITKDLAGMERAVRAVRQAFWRKH